MFNMRILLMIFVLHMTPVTATDLEQAVRNTRQTWGQTQALAPQTVVAQTGYPHPETVTLLTDRCDAGSGHMRAQWVTRDRTVIWGCWHYNPTGVIVQWTQGRSEFIDWFVLWHRDNTMPRQLFYQRFHERVTFLRTMQ